MCWPSFDEPVYVDQLPVWDCTYNYNPTTGVVLPIWDEDLDDWRARDELAKTLQSVTTRSATRPDRRDRTALPATGDQANC